MSMASRAWRPSCRAAATREERYEKTPIGCRAHRARKGAPIRALLHARDALQRGRQLPRHAEYSGRSRACHRGGQQALPSRPRADAARAGTHHDSQRLPLAVGQRLLQRASQARGPGLFLRRERVQPRPPHLGSTRRRGPHRRHRLAGDSRLPRSLRAERRLQALAWWLKDHIEHYAEIAFYPRQCAFNIRWYEGPSERSITHVEPSARTLLTKSSMENFAGDHRAAYAGVLPVRAG